ncbi:MAG TPA: glucose dehydrogenase [Planctomycetota bacterium]|nr:glucose dehydrogenase [Planctomycetota bacterium]
MSCALRVLAICALCVQCYSIRPNSSGADLKSPSPRKYDAHAIELPAGYRVELVAKGLTFPTGIAFDAAGVPHVVESGYSYGEKWTAPRLLRLAENGLVQVVHEGSARSGPWTGIAADERGFVVVEGGALEGGKVLRIAADGQVTELVRDLPSFGDHHANGPAIADDGSIYFGIGTATNSGIVGEDNAKFGWLARRPDFHDIPGKDIVLAGHNFDAKDALHEHGGETRTGAYSPFGKPTSARQVIPGQVPCTGAVLKIPAEGGAPELVAWGFRNPFGLAFGPAGVLYVTDNGYDDRGSRPVWGSGDLLWAVQPGLWYGWPDYSGDKPLTDDEFKPPGAPQPEFLLAEHPNRPPKPAAILDVHCSADGLDFSRSEAFGHVGDAFIALFGDQSPSTGKLLAPVGFKVVRVDVATGMIDEFAANKGRAVAPGSRNDGGGFERPVAVRFDREGKALYVVDFGILTESKSGSRPVEGTGCVWRITRARQ